MEDQLIKNRIIWKDTKKTIDSEFINQNDIYKMLTIINPLSIDGENKLENTTNTTNIIDYSKVKVFNTDVFSIIKYILDRKDMKLLLCIQSNNTDIYETMKHGAISDEHDLYRFTNAFNFIKNRVDIYPIYDNIIYFSNLSMIKNLDNILYEKKYKISALLTTSVKPNLIFEKEDELIAKYQNKNDEIKMTNKIKNMFIIAKKYGYECIIFTDFGCQYNPIKKIIDLFNKYIDEYKIQYVFFGIIDKKNYNIFNKFIKR